LTIAADHNALRTSWAAKIYMAVLTFLSSQPFCHTRNKEIPIIMKRDVHTGKSTINPINPEHNMQLRSRMFFKEFGRKDPCRLFIAGVHGNEEDTTMPLLELLARDIENISGRLVMVSLSSADPYTINMKKVEIAVMKIIHGQPVLNRDALKNPESLDLFRNIPELKV
jgi:hypothetical protein